MKTKLSFKFGVIGLLLTSIISCKPTIQSELTTDQRKAIEDTIGHLVNMLEEAVNQRNLDISFNLFSDDPDFTFSEDGYILPPKDSLYKLIKPQYDNWSILSADYDTMRIIVLNKNSAVFTGEGFWSATNLKGQQMKGHLVSTFVFVNRNNKWQMIHGQTSHAPIK